ncbi:MAG: DUF1615 family protein [Deltaproteobacteria bacterium]
MITHARHPVYHGIGRTLGRFGSLALCLIGICVIGGNLAFPSDLRIIPDQAGSQPSPPGDAAPPETNQAPRPRDKPLPIPQSSPIPDAGPGSLLARKELAIETLQGAVNEEPRLMIDVVHLLDRDAAAGWLSEFLSTPPWNCPVGKKAEWIEAMISAVETNGLPLCKEILGLVACVISIESGFREDPLAVDPSGGEDMASLLARAEQELFQKMGPLSSVPPLPLLYSHYKDRYYPRLLACRTERDVELQAGNIAADLRRDAANLPRFLRERIYAGIEKLSTVVRTKGSMQLNFNRARQVMKDRGECFTDKELTDYLYTVKGGVDVGVAALAPMFVQYAAYYAAPGDLSWLFFVGMDYHYGPFSSRNMMEQIRIRDLSGLQLPLDGDFLHYDERGRPLPRDSITLEAAQTILSPMPRDAIFEAFLLEKNPHYVYTEVHKILAKSHRQKFGETPFAVIGELWKRHEAQHKHATQWKTKAPL